MRTHTTWLARMALVPLALTLTLTLTPRPARAFCGFYVGGAGAKLFNNATMVVLMRDGQRTVLSMQNNYQGPPTDFAMVVPVPIVLQEENVKTLPAAISTAWTSSPPLVSSNTGSRTRAGVRRRGGSR